MGEGSRIERRKNLGKAATQRKRDSKQDAVKRADGPYRGQTSRTGKRTEKQAKETDGLGGDGGQRRVADTKGSKGSLGCRTGGDSLRDLVLTTAPTMGAAKRISRFRRFSLAHSPGFLLCKDLEAQLSPDQENTQGCICNNGRWLSTALVFHSNLS